MLQSQTIKKAVEFYLNETLVEIEDLADGKTLLEYIRLTKKLIGTKEGCAEGDCGACTVLVGRLTEKDVVTYESVNSCIRFLPSLHGTRVVTVEGLKYLDDYLHPVQASLVAKNGSQCGFCTPGIVMSLCALWLNKPQPTRSEIELTLQGNLCRCTGYGTIISAATEFLNYGDNSKDSLILENREWANKLKCLRSDSTLMGGEASKRFIFPNTLNELKSLYSKYPNATIVAGSTDVGLWVTKDFAEPYPMIFLAHLKELLFFDINSEVIEVGSAVTYQTFKKEIANYFNTLPSYLNRIGGEQIRNMGTIGGNIANGSPIGDMAPVLIALGASVMLCRGARSRVLLVEDFFIEYGKQNIEPGEFLYSIKIPRLKPGSIFQAYKVSKRRDEDISTVSGAFWLEIENNKIVDTRLAFGGMAGIPKRAFNAEKKILGKSFTKITLSDAQESLADDFSPLTDFRASAHYRKTIAKNLLLKFFLQFKNCSETSMSRADI